MPTKRKTPYHSHQSLGNRKNARSVAIGDLSRITNHSSILLSAYSMLLFLAGCGMCAAKLLIWEGKKRVDISENVKWLKDPVGQLPTHRGWVSVVAGCITA